MSTRASGLHVLVTLIRRPAHCRRRKIRCLLAEGDPQERCQNCIRLKKECVFYPVDQQQALDNRSQPGVKPGPGSLPSSAVSPSPPELASGRPFERSRQYGSFPSLPSLPSNAPPSFGMPLGSGSSLQPQGEFVPPFPGHGLPSSDGVGVPPSDYAFQQAHADGQRPWEHVSDMNSQTPPMHRMRDSMQPQYWRSSPTAPTADFAPFPNGGSPMSHMPQDPSFPYTVSNAQGLYPSHSHRSTSYGQMPEAGHPSYIQSTAAYPPQPAQEVQPMHHSGAATFPPADGRHTPVMTTGPGHTSAPGGTPIMPYGQPNPFMFQSQGAVTASPIPGQLPYGTSHWYGDNPHYAQADHDGRSPTDQRSFPGKQHR